MGRWTFFNGGWGGGEGILWVIEGGGSLLRGGGEVGAYFYRWVGVAESIF